MLRVGSLVIATRTTGVCAEGERGVCYEVYALDSGDGPRPGYSFIFELGRYDGFSPDEVELMLQPLEAVCLEVAEYRFTNVIQLDRDYEAGVFDAALPVARLARQCREAGRAIVSIEDFTVSDTDATWLNSLPGLKVKGTITGVWTHDSITCPRCGWVSYNANDIRERYCGHCHVFLDD